MRRKHFGNIVQLCPNNLKNKGLFMSKFKKNKRISFK